MTTPAVVSNDPWRIGKDGLPTNNKMEQRKAIREELKRERELQRLETQYRQGEISEFSYRMQKAVINAPVVIDALEAKPMFSTTA